MQDLDRTSPPPIAQLAQPILNYATADQLTPSRRTVIATRVLAVIHLLIGAGALAGAVAVIVENDLSMVLVAIPMGLSGVTHVAIGVLMLRPRPSSWRRARGMLAVLLFPALGFVAFGVVLFILYHDKTGWDQLGAVIGVVMAAIATGPFILNLATLGYLIRPYPRALFGVSVTDRFLGRKTFMRTMAALWVICTLSALVAWFA